MDYFDHSVDLLQNLRIPEAEDREALAFKETCPQQILFVRQRMLTAIEFHHETTLHTAKVDDEGRNWMLTTEFHTTALPGAETVPEPTFNVGLIVPKATSVCD